MSANSANNEIRKALVNARLDELGKERAETLDKLAEIEQSMGSLIDQLRELNKDESDG